MRFGVHIPAWGRRRLLRLVLRQLAECRAQLAPDGVELVVSVSGSVQDGDVGVREIAREHADAYTEVANWPLGAKINAAVGALADYNVDAAVGLGSDDLVTADLFRAWAAKLDNHDYMGVVDGYFYSVPERRLIYWPGYLDDYRLNHTLGMGRCLSRYALERLQWQPFPGAFNSCMDSSMDDRMDRQCWGAPEWKGYMGEIGAVLVDVKVAERGMNPMPFGDEEPVDRLEEWFGAEIAEEVGKC